MTDTPGTLEERAGRIARQASDQHGLSMTYAVAQTAAFIALTEVADEIASLRARVEVLEGANVGLERALDEFMGDLQTRASWDRNNIDDDGTVVLPCGVGVLHRLREARANARQALKDTP